MEKKPEIKCNIYSPACIYRTFGNDCTFKGKCKHQVPQIKSYCGGKENLPDEEEIFVILENLQVEGKGINEFAKAIAKRIGKE